MSKKKTFGFLSLALLGLGLYRFRRHLIGRWLGLQPVRHDITVERNLRVPMPDGITLFADRYAPNTKRLFPTILIRTPYGRSGYTGMSGLMMAFVAQRFAERGYNVIVQDVRGRFESEGRFEPFFDEAEDGRATLAWIEKQPWFNGVLGMWGASYVGYTQWAVAGAAPLYLKAVLPAISSSRLPTTAFRDGAFEMDLIYRWVMILTDGVEKNPLKALLKLRRTNPRRQDRFLSKAFQHLPIREADDKFAGQEVSYFRDWVDHPSPQDPYWERSDHSRGIIHMTAAAHLVAGWYDICLRDALQDYTRLRANGQRVYLTVGPWHHLDLECHWETLRQGLVWFDAALKGDRFRLRDQAVRIFVMGSGWREMESWPPAARLESYYLHPAGRLDRQPVDGESAPDCYVFDPANPTPAVGGHLMNLHAGPQDNRGLEKRKDVLTFSTPPLVADLEVIGTPRLRLYVRSSLDYTDFFGRICDVYPNGRSVNISDGLVRLQPGMGVPQADGSLLIEIELWPTANLFRRGHCLRLQVSSGAHPRWNRNPGTGEPLATATRLLVANQAVYHDQVHPSTLLLPLPSPQ